MHLRAQNFNVNAYINSYTYASTSRSISQLQVQVFAPAHAHAPAPAATSKSTRDSVDLFEPAPRPTTSSSHQHRHHHHETNASALSRAALTYGMRPSTSAGLEHAHSKSSSTSSISGSGSAQHHTTLSTTSTSPTSWSAVVSGAVAEDCSDQASRNKFASDRNAHERTSNQENNKLPSSSPSRVRPSTGCAPASNSALLPAGSLSLKLNLAMPAGAADAKSMQQAQILSAYSLVPHAPRLAQPPRRALQLQLPGNCAGGVLPAPTVLSLKTSEREFYLKASATPTATLAHAHSTGRLHAPVSIQSTATARLLMSTPASLSGRPSTSSRGKTYPVVYSIPGTAAAPPMSSTRTPSGRGTNTLLGSSSNSNRCLPILQLPSVRMTPGRDILAQNYKAAQYCSGNADFKINGHRVVPHDLAVLSGGSTSSLGRRSVNASAWH